MTEIDFEQLCTTITKRMYHAYGAHTNIDDAVQEAIIRAWRDVEDGITDYNYLVNRARIWGKAILFDAHHYPTGDLGRSREGTTRKRSDATREKIKLFVDEYKELHGEDPSIRQIQVGLGTKADISRHLKTIKSHIPLILREGEGNNRINRAAYVFTSLPESVESNGASENEWSSNQGHKAFSTPSFEDESISYRDFIHLIDKIQDPEFKEIAFLYYHEDWSQKDIGVHLGYAHPQSTVTRALKKIHEELRETLDASTD